MVEISINNVRMIGKTLEEIRGACSAACGATAGGRTSVPVTQPTTSGTRSTLSAAGRRKIAQAQRARHARNKQGQNGADAGAGMNAPVSTGPFTPGAETAAPAAKRRTPAKALTAGGAGS